MIYSRKVLMGTLLIACTMILSACLQKKNPASISTGNEGIAPLPNSTGIVAKDNGDNNTTIYNNKEKGFSLQMSSQRTMQENVFNTLVMFFAPQIGGDTIKENLGIIVEKLSGDINLGNYYTLSKGITENVISDYTVQTEEKLEIDSSPAMKIIYKGTEKNHKLEWEQVFLLKEGIAYTFTYTATEETFNTRSKDVNAMINSFTTGA